MVLNVFAVFDVKAEAFRQPFVVPTAGTAMRAFDDVVNRNEPGNDMYSHAEDFVLYQIGTYDDHDGSLVALAPVRMICSGAEVKRSVADRKISAV